MLNITTSIYSTCLEEFSGFRIESFIVYFSLELVIFDMSICAFQQDIGGHIYKKLHSHKVIRDFVRYSSTQDIYISLIIISKYFFR